MACGDDLDEVDPFSAKQADAQRPSIPPERTAVLVVDMVNDYLEPNGLMPVADAGPVIDANRRLVEGARAAGSSIVWIAPGHHDASDGLFRKRIVHGLAGTRGVEFHPGLGVQPAERVVSKRRYSAFFATDLDLWLREHRIERVVVTGVALNICVRATVHDAFFNGYDVWVATDACKATGDRERDSSLYDIQTHYGEVLTVDEVLREWA